MFIASTHPEHQQVQGEELIRIKKKKKEDFSDLFHFCIVGFFVCGMMGW